MHHIEKTIVRGNGQAMLRARCGCGGFEHSVPRLSTPGRRRQNRLIIEHLVSVCGDLGNGHHDADSADRIESPL